MLNRRSFVRKTLGVAGATLLPIGAKGLDKPSQSQSAVADKKYDLVIYGATASGVIAAVAASRQGLKVALVEPGRHVGGMVSGGLGWTDFAVSDGGEPIGGLAREFFTRVTRHYGSDKVRKFNESIGQKTLGDMGWYFEPHVAESIFNQMLHEAGVAVSFKHRILEKGAVTRQGARITEIRLNNGRSFQGRVFVDATYEGDLMAQAGVTYATGRESRAQYGESLAGVLPPDLNSNLTSVQDQRMAGGISAYDSAGKLLPGIYDGPQASIGAADNKCQAYAFRVCLTNDKTNQVAFERPDGYDAAQYELLLRVLNAMQAREGKTPKLERVLKISPLPNGKSDTNNQGPFSSDFINASWNYTEADYATREQLWQKHTAYQRGLLYFIANDPRIPGGLRDEMRQWGLAKDEFVDTGNWSHQLYVRESRRMIGQYVMAQKDVQKEITKPDAIGLGSYDIDSHIVQRRVNHAGYVENEGQIFADRGADPYEIPYRSITPKPLQANNLLVTVCFSTSHVAYQTMRTEPVYMIAGQAAGVAAALAIQQRVAVQDIQVKSLQEILKKQKVRLAWSPASRRNWASSAGL